MVRGHEFELSFCATELTGVFNFRISIILSWPPFILICRNYIFLEAGELLRHAGSYRWGATYHGGALSCLKLSERV